MAVVIVHRRRRGRNFLRRNRIFRDRRNPFDIYDDVEIYAKFRFRRNDILDMVDEFNYLLEYPQNRKGSLPPLLQVMLALRFYATGTFQDVVAETIGVDQSTASRTITRVTNAMFSHFAQWVHLPTQEEANASKIKFQRMAGFPNIIGCIDGTHVRIQAPSQNEHEYVNRKNYHSINVQLICDADMKVINCIAKWPGSVHDARILREFPLFDAFESNRKPLEGTFLGDSGYMLRDWLFTPFTNPRNVGEENYNDAHTQTRCLIERCNGVIKRHYHCLHGEMRYRPGKVCKVICVCVMLHNRAVALRLPLPDEGDFEQNQENDIPEEAVRVDVRERARVEAGKAARNGVVQNFFQ